MRGVVEVGGGVEGPLLIISSISSANSSKLL